MAYVSLYRKYRPQSFAEVVGQTHVTRTLANAIAEDRLHHAYLFTGPRGTGKTSTARILAKAVNCAEGPTPEPCQQCDSCVAITEGSSVDVIELDMASHGGVDDARDLRERALFAPASARKKVYILDEVHMASPAAFNALLKLIEEPPGHVMFAMATTDPQKVLPTIMSRVQRLDLRRVGAQDLVAHIERVASLEGVDLDGGATEAVVRAGDGSVRDTLSIFEQVQSFAGETVTSEDVAQVLGITPAERTFEAVGLLAARDVAGVLALVQDLLDDGHDLRRFAFDLVGHLRDLLVLQVAPERTDLVEGTSEWRQRVAGQSGLLPQETLLRAVDILAETVAEMRRGPARLPLELALAKIATPEAAGDVAALADRVARLETGVATETGSEASAEDGDVPAPTSVGTGSPSAAGREAARRTAQALSGQPDEADTDEGTDEEPDGTGADEGTGEGTDEEPDETDTDEGTDDEPEAAEELREEASADAAEEPGDAATDAPSAAPSAAGTDATDGSASEETDPQDRAASGPDASAEAGTTPTQASDETAEDAEATPSQPPRAAPSETAAGQRSDGPDADSGTSPPSPPDEEGPADDERPAQQTVEVAPPPDTDVTLDEVLASWSRVLDALRERSIRLHAIVQAGTPVQLRGKTLTLAFAQQFHAEETAKTSHKQLVASAVKDVLGIAPQVRTEVGEAERPAPDDETATDDAPVNRDEEAAVREAESGVEDEDDEAAADRAEQLLRDELGAEPVDED